LDADRALRVRVPLRLDMEHSSQERRRNNAPAPPKPRGGPSALAGVRGASRSGSVSVITTDALFARKVQRKVSTQLIDFAAAESSWVGEHRCNRLQLSDADCEQRRIARRDHGTQARAT
jgi:hypothetical protein